MISVEPRNAMARATSADLFLKTENGLIIREGFAAFTSGLFRTKRYECGDFIAPARSIKIVVAPSTETLSNVQTRAKISKPDESEYAVFSVNPPSGSIIHGVSKTALVLGVAYLASGVFTGYALPTSLQLRTLFYAHSGLTLAQMAAMRETMSTFRELRPNVIDTRTQDFYKAMKETREATK